MSVSLPSAYYGVDTVAVRDLGAAFLEGSLGSEVPAVMEQVPSWGDSLLNSALVSAAILLCLAAAPSFSEIFNLLRGSLTRLKPAMDLENNVRLSRERNRFSASEAAQAMNYMAMAGWDAEQMLSGIDGVLSLAAARFSLVDFGFLSAYGPAVGTLAVIGACGLAMLVKMGLNGLLTPRRSGLEYYNTAHSLFLNILTMTATLAVVTIGICSLLKLNDLSVRCILLYELGAAFLLNCIRRLDLSLHFCNLFTAFLYLCALDFFPAALLVSATLFF